jgi:hypothetical protein
VSGQQAAPCAAPSGLTGQELSDKTLPACRIAANGQVCCLPRGEHRHQSRTDARLRGARPTTSTYAPHRPSPQPPHQGSNGDVPPSVDYSPRNRSAPLHRSSPPRLERSDCAAPTLGRGHHDERMRMRYSTRGGSCRPVPAASMLTDATSLETSGVWDHSERQHGQRPVNVIIIRARGLRKDDGRALSRCVVRDAARERGDLLSLGAARTARGSVRKLSRCRVARSG